MYRFVCTYLSLHFQLDVQNLPTLLYYIHLYSVVTPTQISYSDNTQLSGDTPLVNVSQLGPAVDVSFLVRNSGPSRVPSISLEIMWPLSSTLTGENFYLYITSVQVGYVINYSSWG